MATKSVLREFVGLLWSFRMEWSIFDSNVVWKFLLLIVGSEANDHHIIWSSSDINLRRSFLM